MVCAICGKKSARTRRVTRSYGRGQELLLIENVPVVRCRSCGESYLTAETLHEIERIKLHRKSFATQRPIAVAGFSRRSRKTKAAKSSPSKTPRRLPQ